MEKFKNALSFLIIFIITSDGVKMIGKNFVTSKEEKTSSVNNLKSAIHIHDIEKEMLAFVNIATSNFQK
ncbi:MAG: hypothetical protein KUA37_02705 [Desulfomicrobium sp.]|nr:hypothetical protein [Pseudomonadota bacterium]MBV1710904.1 hypothetical protein [Desulfomicrobium sp.]MBU4570558.1 hypothetical protein [Pseudomonadota bacterium]MBU4593322.1 hypothetical protein [Pseudomonadota bacterium]MBV1719364.1 hypothetical protein [Desulfomicrobium sp.]